ncbi:MAG: protein-glutamate O-methyltransferase family protein [Chloroflexi bacterium]|nr:protein-glutamate O-methyltransferase family protein [Chloroflexota bacterium]
MSRFRLAANDSRRPAAYPGAILTDPSNEFASHTMQVRIPAILQQVIDVNAGMTTSQRDAIERLREGVATGQPVPALAAGAPDVDEWQMALSDQPGRTWHDVEWFFAETYLYRVLMDAVGYFANRHDPFGPIKAEEYASDSHRTLIEQALSVTGTREDALYALIGAALWGNRVDLSYAESRAHGASISTDDLLVDDRAAAIEALAGAAHTVHLVADNAGSELSADLVLIDRLLRDKWAGQVVLHVKAHPTFVSDAITDDVIQFLRRAVDGAYGDLATGLGARLIGAVGSGTLRLSSRYFWNSAAMWWDMPDELHGFMSESPLTIVKGDANYRRVVGDARWPYETPFHEVVTSTGIPVLCLRTLKSDPIVGLQPGQAEHLESIDSRWRWSGKRGVIQGWIPKL